MAITKNVLPSLPLPLARALKQFGTDLKDARRRRRISVAVMAERTGISRMTLNKIEKGEPGVSFGSYGMVLFVLGLTERLSTLVELKNDALGLELAERDLPQRIRKPKTNTTKKRKK